MYKVNGQKTFVSDLVALQVRNFGSSIKTGIFIIGSTVLVLAAARNSLTWYVSFGISCSIKNLV